MKLRNKDTGAWEEVPDVVGAVESGTYEKPSTVTYRAPSGAETTTSYERFKEYRSAVPEATVVSSEELSQRAGERVHRREHGEGLANQFQAGLGGLIKGASLGFISPWEEEQGYFKTTSTIGELAGIIGPGLATGGGATAARLAGKGAVGAVRRGAVRTVLANTPAGLVARGAERAGARLLKSGVGMAEQGAVRRVGSMAVSAGVEGAAASGISEVGRQVREDEALDLEAVASKALLGGGLGLGLGAGIGAAGEAYRKGASAVRGIGGGPSKKALSAVEKVKADVPRSADEIVSAPRTRAGEDAIPAIERKATRGMQGDILDIERDIKKLVKLAGKADEARGAWASKLDEDAVMTIEGAGVFADDALEALGWFKAGQMTRAQTDEFIDRMGRVQNVANKLDAAGFGTKVPRTFNGDELAARYDHMVKNGIPNPEAYARELSEEQVENAAAAWLIPKPSRAGTDLAAYKASRGFGGFVMQQAKEKLLGKLGIGGIGGGYILGDVMGGGIGKAVGMLPEVAAVGGAMKAAELVSRHPTLGGVIAGGAADVLSRSPLFVGDSGEERPSPDARKALKDFANRVRSVDRGKVASSAAGIRDDDGSRTGALAALMERRLGRLTELLDRVSPAQSAGAQLLGGRLPSAVDARTIAEHVRVSLSPQHALQLLIEGKLTPELLKTLQTVFPRSAEVLRMLAMSMLAEAGGENISPKARKALQVLMSDVDPEVGSSRAAYLSAMQESAQRSAPQQPPKQPSAVPSVSDLYSSDRIAKAAGK